MKCLTCLLFLIIFVLTGSKAQEIKSKEGGREKVSGYLGLKNIVSVTGLFSFSQRPQKPLNDVQSQEYTRFTINRKFEIIIERAITNRKSIGIFGGVMNTSMMLRQDFYLLDWGNYINELVTFYGTPPIKDRYIGLSYKIFRKNKGGFAPIGSYLGIHGIKHHYTIDYSNISYLIREGSQKEKVYDLKTESWDISKVEIGFSTGLSRAIGKSVKVDFGTRFGVLLAPYFFRSILTDYCVGDDFATDVEDFVYIRTMRRLCRTSLVNYYISVGYMF